MQNPLFFSLGCCEECHTLNIRERDQNDWLQFFRNGHMDLFRLLIAADLSIEIRKESERQTISLFRSFLEFFHDRVNCRQHNFGMDYTTSQNASLCVTFLGIFCSRQFGHFDLEEMQDALFKSKLFAEQSRSDMPNILDWGLYMMACVPVGFSDNYLV